MKISKNYLKGEAITSIEQINEIAKNKGAVYVSNWRVIRPAMVMIHLQASFLLRLIEYGNIHKIIKDTNKS